MMSISRKTAAVVVALTAAVGGQLVAAGAAAADYAGCQTYWLCLYQDKNFNRNAPGKDEFDALNKSSSNVTYNTASGEGFNDEMSSWVSQRGHYSRWYWDTGGNGNSRCMKPNWYVSQVTGTENDQASSIRLYGDSTRC